jgi:hypothetical protein
LVFSINSSVSLRFGEAYCLDLPIYYPKPFLISTEESEQLNQGGSIGSEGFRAEGLGTRSREVVSGSRLSDLG